MFSGTIKIADIDDFISPSQSCIKPMAPTKQSTNTTAKGVIKFEAEPELMFPVEKPKLIKLDNKQTAKVSLTDCLACSGCVTTAETILIEQQSVEEFLKRVQEAKTTIVFLSPQARASLAYKLKLTEAETQIRISQFLKLLGVRYVFDMSVFADIALLQAEDEFITNYKNKTTKGATPILCSECPGWVCYSEKKLGETAIPFMSKVKSPQQIAGTFAKNVVPSLINQKTEDIYCVTIMPCYDKKLEATRAEFEKNKIKEVDTVLTASEVADFLERMDEQRQTAFSGELTVYTAFELEDLFRSGQETAEIDGRRGKMPKLTVHKKERCSSYPYVEQVLLGAAQKIFNRPDLSERDVKYTNYKNKDFEEAELKIDEQNTFKFARVYGLRNIQIVTSQMKKGEYKYDYVEIMACPGGCLNGGGQVKIAERKPREVFEEINNAYHTDPTKVVQAPAANQFAEFLFGKYQDQLEIKSGVFKAVEKTNFNPLAIKW